MEQTNSISEERFRQKIEPLLGRAGGYAYSLTGKREDAEDAVQDAALKAFLYWDGYDPSQNFKGWFFTIIRNCCFDLLRKKRSRPDTLTLEDTDQLPGDKDRREEIKTKDELGRALAQLAPLHREILELKYFGDCSYREIAAVLGIPQGTVMSRIHAARQALAAIYRKDIS